MGRSWKLVNFIGVASMSAEYPIPRSFADALGEMVVSYAAGDWTPDGEDYCRVSIDQAAYTYELISVQLDRDI